MASRGHSLTYRPFRCRPSNASRSCPRGTAALYGSDAIGGVVNIILRKDFEGVEARVRGSATDSDATERSAALLWVARDRVAT